MLPAMAKPVLAKVFAMQALSPATLALLTLPPLMWAGNAIVGRLMDGLVPPLTLNFLRWALAIVVLLPLAWRVLTPGSALWTHWRRFALLGLLGVGLYNSLQYLALKTSTPINVTLVAASTPVWMLLVGRLGYRERITARQTLGAALSIAGVLVVLARGDWAVLMAVRLVPGDFYILLASIAWAWYSWLLARPDTSSEALRKNVPDDWAGLLMAQMAFGLLWSAAFAAGEWLLPGTAMVFNANVAAALVFIALGPALLAYRCWGAGVQRAGPTVASFFANLTPLFAALMSAAFLGEPPQLHHAAAFVLIVGGIVVSARR